MEMRQARKYREEEEVLKLISQAKRFLERKKEIEQAMSTMQKMSALRNLGPMGPLEETQSRDHKKLSFSRKNTHIYIYIYTSTSGAFAAEALKNSI